MTRSLPSRSSVRQRPVERAAQLLESPGIHLEPTAVLASMRLSRSTMRRIWAGAGTSGKSRACSSVQTAAPAPPVPATNPAECRFRRKPRPSALSLRIQPSHAIGRLTNVHDLHGVDNIQFPSVSAASRCS
jgi:hypothetical protein